MGHDDQLPPGDIIEPGGEPADECVVGLTVGGAEIPFVTPIAVKYAGRQGRDLVAVEAIPGADRDFLEALVEHERRGIAARGLDQLGGAPGTAERAGDNRQANRLRQDAHPAADRLGLGEAAAGQRRIAPALIAPGEVPLGLAVAHQEDDAAHRRAR